MRRANSLSRKSRSDKKDALMRVGGSNDQPLFDPAGLSIVKPPTRATAVGALFYCIAVICKPGPANSTILLVKLSYRLFWLAPVFLSWGCASVLDEDGALAIARYGIEEDGRIVVDARVNGQGPFNFALDTGASISVVFDRLSDELGLQPVPGKTLMIHGILASGQVPIGGHQSTGSWP